MLFLEVVLSGRVMSHVPTLMACKRTANLLGESDSIGDGVSDAGKPKRGRPKRAGDPKGGAKRGQSKGVISCRACKASFNSDECSCDTVFCPECKKLLDRLSRIAAKEGDESTKALRDARQDPKRISCMIKKFKEKIGHLPVRKGKQARSLKSASVAQLNPELYVSWLGLFW